MLFLFLKPMYYNNNSIYLESNVLSTYNLYFKNVLLSFFGFKNNIDNVTHSQNTPYKENINICVAILKKKNNFF